MFDYQPCTPDDPRYGSPLTVSFVVRDADADGEVADGWLSLWLMAENRCAKDLHYQYNAELIFNEVGDLVTRYYKSHPWFTPGEDAPTVPDRVTFKVFELLTYLVLCSFVRSCTDSILLDCLAARLLGCLVVADSHHLV